MTFASFATTLATIEQTTLRNEITAMLAQVFSALQPDEIEPACWLLLGRVLPPYEGIEFQFAEKMMVRALAQAYEHDPAAVLAQYKASGDLATVAQALRVAYAAEAQEYPLSRMYQELVTLAHQNGAGSQERKVTQVVMLLRSLDPVSVKYFVRILLTKLRLGFSDMTLLDALSWTVYGDKRARKVLEDAYQKRYDIGKLATTFLTHKEAGLASVDITLGIPLQPALCQRLKTATEMIEKMGMVYVEAKYDGTRVQIHRQPSGEWQVRTFTRSLEESSAMFPELVAATSVFGTHTLIVDCEAVGVDTATGKLLPFQETIQRKRKHDVGLFSQKIPLRFFVFDILYLDGRSLIDQPLSERKRILHELFAGTPDDSMFVESPFIQTDDADTLRDFHKKQLHAGLEGAVIKQVDSPYQPGRKGYSWVKFKEEETAQAKLSDTIDAVVMGYWYGKGKRNQFGIGAFLIGVTSEAEGIVTLSKVGTGLSDEQWRDLAARLQSLKVEHKPTTYLVDTSLVPDVWVTPSVVVEVAGDELTKSPTHSAKVALRFPRLVRFRDDKTAQQITSLEELGSIA